jgi:hypothetical protein
VHTLDLQTHRHLPTVHHNDVALTELVARQIEELLWKLFYGLPV